MASRKGFFYSLSNDHCVILALDRLRKNHPAHDQPLGYRLHTVPNDLSDTDWKITDLCVRRGRTLWNTK